MRFLSVYLFALLRVSLSLPTEQVPLLRHANTDRPVSPELFSDLEELARIVDISYCVGLTGIGVSKPFRCLSRCSEFPTFELVKTWNTGQLMSDSCGYIAVDHDLNNPRILVAFRGTYSIANAVVDLSTKPQEYAPYPGETDSDPTKSAPRCTNCTVHTGFYSSWNITSPVIIPDIEAALAAYPGYQLNLVGHSLGGAVAALAGLDFVSRGWDPIVTTFGEPRIGNKALMHYMDARFSTPTETDQTPPDLSMRYRRVTHIDDPVPLLPLSEWGYRMHAGEIYITKPSLSPDIQDLQLCDGDEDPRCIAGQDASLSAVDERHDQVISLRDVARYAQEMNAEDDNVSITGWVPARYKLWQLFFAHRDYFWRLGLCVPGGDPWDWGRERPIGEESVV
ncbi:hypothetical protein MBLNU457_1947t1 [Dothideomycetes sp. NU457]